MAQIHPSLRKISFVTSLFLGASGVLAQQPGGMAQSPASQQMTPGQPGQPGAPGQPGSPDQPGTPGQPSANDYVDQGFVRTTLQDDEDQEALSQLAAQKSSSADIKKLSQDMIQVHTSLDNQLKPVAKQFGIKDPQKPNKKEKHELASLQNLSGPAFDSAYLQALAKDQQHTLKAMTDEAKSSPNPSLQKAAAGDESTLNQNYEVLKKVAAAHNVTLDQKK
jgi:putative membrane protein